MNKEELVTINMTFKVARKNVIGFENYFRVSPQVILNDFRVVPNTEHLSEDESFKNLVKAVKKAKDAKYDYINRNANKPK